MKINVDIEPEWHEVLAEVFEDKQFEKLAEFVRSQYISEKIFPRPENIFKAFWLTPFSKVKVVILDRIRIMEMAKRTAYVFLCLTAYRCRPLYRISTRKLKVIWV